MAMSRDGLVPTQLGAVSSRRGTPAAAIALTAFFMTTMILLLELKLFVKAASAMQILLFMFVMLSHVLMRESHIPTYQPSWRCPLYPWLQIGGIVSYGFLLVELGSFPLAIAAAILGAATAWYAFYAKVHVLRESALVRLAERLVRADFDDHDVEAELSRITRERDRLVLDRFDHLIQDCPVLDLPAGTTRDALFRTAADRLAPSVGRSAEETYELLLKRENLSSTVVRPGLAIPHLILDDVREFCILLIRCREGVVFGEAGPPVHTAFILAASPQERDFYLKALMAIAEIAQDPDFDPKWTRAGGPEALREVVLAAERRREQTPGP
jgi:mannitol/fructose-specific phosphotransferase system IIA component (Ntr-type)